MKQLLSNGHDEAYSMLYPCSLLFVFLALELFRNLVAHGDAREGKWRGNWLMDWVASTLTPPPNVVYPALLKLIRKPWLPAVDWTDAPNDLNGLVCFGEKINLVSARVPSGSARALHPEPSWPVLAWTRPRLAPGLAHPHCFFWVPGVFPLGYDWAGTWSWPFPSWCWE